MLRIFLALGALFLLAGSDCGPLPSEHCPHEVTKTAAAELAGSTFAFRSASAAWADVVIQTEQPLVALRLPRPDAPGPTLRDLRAARVGDTLPDGSTVIGRDARALHLRLDGADLQGAVRVVRIGADAGPLALTATISAPPVYCAQEPDVTLVEAATCGNGLVEGGERCDDGNDAAGDGCAACAPEGASCAGDAIAYWACAGQPSDCTQRRCRGDECPPEVGTRSVVVSAFLRGASDPATSVRITSADGGMDCHCRAGLPGPVCEGACAAGAPACAPYVLSADPPAAAWGGDCAGQGPTCTLDGVAPAVGEAIVDLGGDVSARLVDAAQPYDDRGEAPLIALSETGDVALSALYAGATTLPGLAPPDDTLPRRFVAVLDADGAPRWAQALGKPEEVVVQALAFSAGTLFAAGAAGDLRVHAHDTIPTPDEYPRAFVRAWDADGAPRWSHPLDVFWGPHAALAPLPDGVAAAFAADRPIPNGWGGLTAALVRLDDHGEDRWRWTGAGPWIDLEALALDPRGRLVIGGLYRGGADPPDPLLPFSDDPNAVATFTAAFAHDAPDGASGFAIGPTRAHLLVTPAGAVTLLTWAPGAALTVVRTQDAGFTPWSVTAARPSPCLDARLDQVPHLAVDRATGAVAVAVPECGADATEGFAVHLLSPDGRWQRTWRFGRDAAKFRFGSAAFAPDGAVVVAAHLRGAALGVESADAFRPVLLRLR
jgi:cysteine-rich repeat protein